MRCKALFVGRTLNVVTCTMLSHGGPFTSSPTEKYASITNGVDGSNENFSIGHTKHPGLTLYWVSSRAPTPMLEVVSYGTRVATN